MHTCCELNYHPRLGLATTAFLSDFLDADCADINLSGSPPAVAEAMARQAEFSESTI